MNLKEKYKKEVALKLKEKFGYRNNFEIPRLIKTVINVGIGRQAKDKEFVDEAVKTVRLITGQQPVITKAKKAISSFKIKEGMVMGVVATLRGKRMYDFTEKMINISLPRVRDFRGLNQKQVDRSGNLTVGIKEQVAFPEIKTDEIGALHGMEATFVTNARNREEGLELFKLIGFPFREEK